MNHYFNTNIAKDYDVNVSIFVDYVKYWTFNNLANKRNVFDGFCWTYNTLDAFLKIFPFWTKRQLETVINKAVSTGLLLKDNYNKNRYDRTCWYALSYKAYAYYEDLRQPDFAESLYNSISPKSEINFLEWGNQVLGIVTPIPITIPVTNNNNTIGTSIEDAEEPEINPSKKTRNKKPSFGVEQLQADNPHEISEGMLSDWLEVRQSKRNRVTQTAWNKINRTLTLIQKEAGIKPQEAFETMVTGAWQSLELKYFLNKATDLPSVGVQHKNGIMCVDGEVYY